ncbi:hypothetical protein F511_08189 [Dorcoceras hygrometricum]|uniref:Protein SPT2 homolog n=1 Tax=Dorcoceras hygrometricum TaxID=472368 RepID=A0A2Z7DB82_9LAMI|nr:hypothetical protein F511_08189 [Dorcoceras hygrometricum]
MHGYDRDEYEDLDEYENDGTEPEEEEEDEGGYEEEETFQPTQDELEYLELRKRLKESIRKQMKKELGTANTGSRDKANTYRKDNYGSFFGPSQPVIAQRVIQESKSLLENPNLAARIVKPKYENSKSSVTSNVRSKHQPSLQTKVTSGLKKKVEMLKNTRDYSFLLSEDAEVPVPIKSPPSRNVPVPKSEAQSAQLLSTSKRVVNDRGREASNGYEHRKHMISGSQTKGVPEKIDRTSRLSVESRKQLGSNSGSGPGRPLGPKPIPPRDGSNSGSGPGRPLGPKSIPSRGGGNSGSGPGRPLGPKSVPSRSGGPSLGTKVTQSIAKNSMVGREKSNPSPAVQSVVRKPTSYVESGVRKPVPSSSRPSLMKNQSVQRKEYQETSKPKIIPRQTLPPSRDHVKQPSTKVSARGTLADVRPKAKIGRQPYADDSDDDQAINMIRKMFGYNPNKYQDADDDSDMEANFDDILREERLSEKIAMQEDEEELRKLEEEEMREQEMRKLKKRKLSR